MDLFSFIICLFSYEFRLKTFSSSPTLMRICYRNNVNLHVHNYNNLKERKVNGQKQPSEVFYKKVVLWNFTKFTGKYLCLCLFFNKVAGLRPEVCSFIKKRLWHRCFPVDFVKSLRTPFLQNTSGRLFLNSALTILIHGSTYPFLNSLQKFIEIQSWLLLTFFICLRNELGSFNSIILQMPEKRDSSNRQ